MSPHIDMFAGIGISAEGNRQRVQEESSPCNLIDQVYHVNKEFKGSQSESEQASVTQKQSTCPRWRGWGKIGRAHV